MLDEMPPRPAAVENVLWLWHRRVAPRHHVSTLDAVMIGSQGRH